ncbi:Ecotropic viral integration site 5 protein [Seminavis robusta]|uniref:Ecotropic viral integration site 5 protein n=1 Tax=Seminavis robusta TaxID=568900 RepID=A0A9N8DP98_9STRA|nr:Ecotropic viral integration site 5 protein [Seminavis robusta]|eukprot:Sro273_g105160.1 Ecotropic viral integration site 5 protein (2479) ;mRNA; r:42014-49521
MTQANASSSSEESDTAIERPGPNHAAAASGGAYTNRRQKNLQKFRRQFAAQRQTSDGKPSDTKASNETQEPTKNEADTTANKAAKNDDGKSVNATKSDDKSLRSSRSCDKSLASAKSDKSMKSDDKSTMSVESGDSAVKASKSLDKSVKSAKSDARSVQSVKSADKSNTCSDDKSVNVENNFDKTVKSAKSDDKSIKSNLSVDRSNNDDKSIKSDKSDGKSSVKSAKSDDRSVQSVKRVDKSNSDDKSVKSDNSGEKPLKVGNNLNKPVKSAKSNKSIKSNLGFNRSNSDDKSTKSDKSDDKSVMASKSLDKSDQLIKTENKSSIKLAHSADSSVDRARSRAKARKAAKANKSSFTKSGGKSEAVEKTADTSANRKPEKTGNESAAIAAENPKPQAPLSPIPSRQPAHVHTAPAEEHSNSTLANSSPISSKRRSHIIKKLSKKTRHPPATTDSPEVHETRTLDSEDGPPLLPAMTDSTNNSKEPEVNGGDKPKVNLSHRGRLDDRQSVSPLRKNVEVHQTNTLDSDEGQPPVMTDSTNNTKEAEEHCEKPKMPSLQRRRRRPKKTEPEQQTGEKNNPKPENNENKGETSITRAVSSETIGAASVDSKGAEKALSATQTSKEKTSIKAETATDVDTKELSSDFPAKTEISVAKSNQISPDSESSIEPEADAPIDNAGPHQKDEVKTEVTVVGSNQTSPDSESSIEAEADAPIDNAVPHQKDEAKTEVTVVGSNQTSLDSESSTEAEADAPIDNAVPHQKDEAKTEVTVVGSNQTSPDSESSIEAEADAPIDNTVPQQKDEATSNGNTDVESQSKKIDVVQETSEADNAEVTASGSFDLRSIHAFPTKPIAEASAALPPRDPSWDTAKVIFNEFDNGGPSKSDAIDLFDTGDPMSWGTSNVFSDPFDATSLGENIFSEVKEEKKEEEHFSSQPLSSPHRSQLSQTQLDSPSNNSAGFDMSSVASDEPGKEVDESESNAVTIDEKDVDNLLADGDSGDVWINKSQPSKEERLQQYTSPAPRDDDSSQSSSKEEIDDDDSSQEPPEVDYVPQMEEKKENEESSNSATDIDSMPFPVVPVDEAPAFEQAAFAASASAESTSTPCVPGFTEHISSCPVPAETNATSVDSFIPATLPVPEMNPKNLEPLVSLSASSSSTESKPDGALAESAQFPGDFGSCDGYISKSSSSSTFYQNGGINKQAANGFEGSDAHSERSDSCTSEDNLFSDGSGLQYSAESDTYDLEESPSLVGVSLVPSFGANVSKPGKVREGIPPKSSLSPSMLPPPPPPPLSKRKKKKKKRRGSDKRKEVPLLAPPSEEKLKKWLGSSGKAMHLGTVRESMAEINKGLETIGMCSPSARTQNRPKVEGMACGALTEEEIWEPVESPGRIKISCGGYGGSEGSWAAAVQSNKSPTELKCSNFAAGQWDADSKSVNSQTSCVGGISDAFDLAGLNVTPATVPQSSSHTGPTPSPVDAARSKALENAMRRVNQGSSSRFDFGANAREVLDTKSLFENDAIASTSMETSVDETRSGQDDEAGEPSTVDVEPPQILRTELNLAINDNPMTNASGSSASFLETLTSPSLSMSPTNNGKTREDVDDVQRTSTPTSSPIIHDTKMAEKVAMASHAAAVTFEETYSASRSNLPQHAGDDAEETTDLPSLFCAPEIGENLHDNIQRIPGGEEAARLFFGQDSREFSSKDTLSDLIAEKTGILKDFAVSSPSREEHSFVRDLSGGAFSPWRNGVYAKKPMEDRQGSITFAATSSSSVSVESELMQMHRWLTVRVLQVKTQEALLDTSDSAIRTVISNLLKVDENLNKLCDHTAEKVNAKIQVENDERAKRNAPLSPRKKMRPFTVGRSSGQKSSSVVAANFVSFIHRVSKAAGIPSPFGEENPFLLDLVTTSIHGTPKNGESADPTTMQRIVFRLCPADKIVIFCAQVCGGVDNDCADVVEPSDTKSSGASSFDLIEATRSTAASKKSKSNEDATKTKGGLLGEQKWIVPDEHPSPFESLVQHEPKMLAVILDYLGDPVAVCRMKMTSRSCHSFVDKNEQILMRDAVRLGGLSMHVRPSFWLWVILEKCSETTGATQNASENRDQLMSLEEAGRTGKYHNVIQRDVARAFGNMPPHKTGSRLRTDSIVRALVTWGKNRIMKRGVKGDGNPPPSSGRLSTVFDSESEASQTRTDTVSDWGGVSPVPSFAGSCNGTADGEDRSTRNDDGRKKGKDVVSTDLLVLGGNALTDEMKADLQNKLAFILHGLAATHLDVGYCQGMDYVVAHLLRILQETVCWRAAHGTLPASILSAPKFPEVFDEEAVSKLMEETDNTLVVEETIYRVMDCLFTTFNLRHMYWPELRCLKTCCRVFEKLIQLKLPVLADHFEHHELNVGLFALGWFQTLFLYLPSMPSATVCHIWDIWLVERSFKIFFRVGTAILFLSQPILLNHELEGMMTYLNTFPDATLLNPDILIACALQIKVTNKMLMEIEENLQS